MAAHCLPSAQEELNGLASGSYFYDDDLAREYLEARRWPQGPVCPHCADINNAYRLHRKESKKDKHVRKGVWKCRACREQFTVTVGTVMEDSHIPLGKWLLAIQMICASEQGISAHQLHLILKITYRSAWFMGNRLRYAMGREPVLAAFQSKRHPEANNLIEMRAALRTGAIMEGVKHGETVTSRQA